MSLALHLPRPCCADYRFYFTGFANRWGPWIRLFWSSKVLDIRIDRSCALGCVYLV